MPKKTKKAKIAAQHNKQTTASHSHIHITYAEKPTVEISSKNSFSKSVSSTIEKPMFNTVELQKTTQNFQHDLKKSLIIVFFILALELGLYYAGMQGLLKFM